MNKIDIYRIADAYTIKAGTILEICADPPRKKFGKGDVRAEEFKNLRISP